MKRPDFLKGVTPATSAPIAASALATGQMKPVAWAAAPLEPAAPLPMQALTAPPAVIRAMPMPAPPPSPAASAPDIGFEALESASAPGRAMAPVAAPPPPPPRSPEVSVRAEAAIRELKLIAERLGEQARSDALEVGLLVARKILEREISTNHEALFALIKSAIRRMGESREIVVRLCPQDAERLEPLKEGELALASVKIRADESLSPGDVMVDSEHHTVDGRLTTRLDEIARVLDGDE